MRVVRTAITGQLKGSFEIDRQMHNWPNPRDLINKNASHRPQAQTHNVLVMWMPEDAANAMVNAGCGILTANKAKKIEEKDATAFIYNDVFETFYVTAETWVEAGANGIIQVPANAVNFSGHPYYSETTDPSDGR